MDARLSRHRTPGSRGRSLPALLLISTALMTPAVSSPAWAQGAGPDSVRLVWTAPGDDGNQGTADHYEMRMSQSTITEGNWSQASVVPDPPAPRPAGSRETMTVRGLTNGVTYYFAIKAVDDAGNVAPISNVLRWNWVLDSAPPLAPTSVTATVENGGAQVRLAWAPNGEPDLASYTVYRRVEPNGTFDPLAVGVTTNGYLDQDLPPGASSVWYQVTATDQSGNESARSATVAVAIDTNAPASTWSMSPAYPNPGSVGSPVNLPVDVPTQGAGTVQLQIVDAGGHVVRRIDLAGVPPGSQTITWDGKNAAGRLAAPGVYTAWLVGADTPRSLKLVRVP